MAKSFIHSPLTPLLLIVALAIGVLGLMITPRQEDPQISVPMVDIFVRYPGASSEQVSSLVADPLERIMSEIPGVNHVYSASKRNEAIVTVEFVVGEEMETSLVKLYDKLQSNVDKIPPGVSQPLVKPKGVDDVPVVTLTLWSPDVDDATLNLVALDVLQRIKEVPDTSQGFVVKGRSEQLRIEVLPERLAGYDISLEQIASTIKSANSEQSAGTVEAQGRSLELYTGSFLTSADDVERLILGIRNGSPVYVRDVAKVTLGPGETHALVNYYTGMATTSKINANGLPAVTLAIAKKKGSNGVTVAENVLERVESLKGRIIPDNINVSVTRNYGETASEKVNELILKLFIATAAVAVLVLIAIGMHSISLGLRAASVVLVVVPVVILVTVFSAWLLGYTIDRVSLFALIFSIGILVDDAIVVVENIYRRWLEQGEIDTASSVDAVAEVGNPTILATFTVVAALLPMGFVSGMMGPYMEPIPALGSVAMLLSLFAAFIFTPWLAMRLKPSLSSLEKAGRGEHKQNEKLERFFRGLLLPLLTDRRKGFGFLVGVIVIFFLCCALFYVQAVRVKMLPLDNKPEFNIVVNFPEGTALPVTANATRLMAERLREYAEVTAVQTYTGTASPFNFNGLVRHYYLRTEPWQADIQVQLVDRGLRVRTSHDIAVLAREELTPIAAGLGARVQIVEMPPGPPVLQSIVAEVYGPDADTRRQVAKDLTGMFERAANIADVDNYIRDDYDLWQFEVNREKALRAGVTVDDVNRTLELAMGGYVLGDIKRESLLDPTFIVLQLPLEVRSDLARLQQLPVVSSANGNSVPLSELGELKLGVQDPVIYQKDLRPVEYVTGEGVGNLAAPIYGMLEVESLLKNYTTPDGVSLQSHYLGPPASSLQSGFEWGGEWTVTYETFRDMGAAFGVALILIYMLVVWEFGNFTLPAIIMAPIPLTLIGIIPGHWLFNAEFTATSMIGFIALAGIIVRNSILLVDFARHEIDRGMHVIDAMIQACKTRTRPILITALALVAGSSVILFDPIFQGMAISLMFGVLVSTLLTLLVIPLGCVSGRRAFLPNAPFDDERLVIDSSYGGYRKSGSTASYVSHEANINEPSVFVKAFKKLGLIAYFAFMYFVLLVADFFKGIMDIVKAMREWRFARQHSRIAESKSQAPKADKPETDKSVAVTKVSVMPADVARANPASHAMDILPGPPPPADAIANAGPTIPFEKISAENKAVIEPEHPQNDASKPTGPPEAATTSLSRRLQDNNDHINRAMDKRANIREGANGSGSESIADQSDAEKTVRSVNTAPDTAPLSERNKPVVNKPNAAKKRKSGKPRGIRLKKDLD